MFKPGDIVFLSKGFRPWNDFLREYETHFVTHFQQSEDSLAIGPGKYHQVKLIFEISDDITRVQVRLTNFVVGPRLKANRTYDRDQHGAKIMYYTWNCEPADNVLSPEIAFNASGQKCQVYLDRFVMRKDSAGKLISIERLVPIETPTQDDDPASKSMIQ